MDPGAADGRIQEVTVRFDAAHESVVRTPVLNTLAPETPLPLTDAGTAPATPGVNADKRAGDAPHVSTIVECKTEQDLDAVCVAASESLSVFPCELQANGLIQIDRSSGSDSPSGSSSERGDSSDDDFSCAVPKPAYTERVPDGFSFHVHCKSKILHKALEGKAVSMFKAGMNDNFNETPRVFHVTNIPNACAALSLTTIGLLVVMLSSALWTKRPSDANALKPESAALLCQKLHADCSLEELSIDSI